jgi:hypothetical protein
VLVLVLVLDIELYSLVVKSGSTLVNRRERWPYGCFWRSKGDDNEYEHEHEHEHEHD